MRSLNPGTVMALQKAAKRVPGWLVGAGKAWLRWFWRLGRVSKIVATAVEIVLVWLATSRLPIDERTARNLVEATSLLLAFLLIAGLVFAPTRRS